MKKLLIYLFFSISLSGLAQIKEIPFTIEDRDRIIRTEERLNSIERKMDTQFNAIQIQFDGGKNQFGGMQNQFDSIQKQLDTMQTLLYFVLGLVVTLFGYVVWDRRSAFKPLLEAKNDMYNKYNKIIEILMEIGEKDPKAKLIKN